MIKRERGILLCLLTAFVSGFSIFINKFGVKGIDPFLFSGLKNILVTVFLLSLILGAKELESFKKLSKKDWLALFFIGLIGGSIPFLLFFKGLTLTSAPQAAFIHKNMFLLVAVLAPILLKEKLAKNFFLAACLLLLGNILLLNKAFPFSLNSGNILILGATFLWAWENIISKKTLQRLPVKIVAWGRMFFGSLLIMIFLGFSGKMELLTSLNINQLLWVLITSFFLLAYVVSWYSGLKHLRASTATSILALGAPITSILSILAGGILNNKEMGGIILLLTGIILLGLFTPKVKISHARS